jgi:cation diffusion facilitator family transporter
MSALAQRDRLVRRVLLIEGAANIVVLLAKAAVGLATGSLAVLGDAVHSLTDVANNVVALIVLWIAARPPDRDHPWGHRKFETLAVFGLAGLLTVTAFEIGLRALTSPVRDVQTSAWALGTMIAVLAVNVALATWQGRWARRLDSEILRADARHTLGDVLTTVAVIAGWQLSVIGPAWLDSAFAVGVAGVVLYLAYGLFKRSIPILTDSIAVPPEELHRAVGEVHGVETVARVRSRHTGSSPAVDVVVTIEPGLTTVEGHSVADRIESALRESFGIEDVTVHLEPEQESSG